MSLGADRSGRYLLVTWNNMTDRLVKESVIIYFDLLLRRHNFHKLVIALKHGKETNYGRESGY